MLVLTRKRSETIQIGDDILIKVLKTGKTTVKIGIEAPRQIRVLRGELCEAGVPAKADVPAKVEQTIDFPGESYSETAIACSDQFPQPHVA